MKKVLINVIHPNIGESRVNKALSERVRELENVTINNLYEKYPDFNIDVKKEQELLLENDVIVFQFPMYWLSTPALLKQWFDFVLAYNFAFGENYKLEGKEFAIAVSTGSLKEQYSPTGSNGRDISEFLAPLERTATYVKMKYKNYFLTDGTLDISDEKIEEFTSKYVEFVKEL